MYPSVNGVPVRRYYLEEGERVFLFAQHERGTIRTYMALMHGEIVGEGISVLRWEDGFIVTPSEFQEKYLLDQREAWGAGAHVLCSIVFDAFYALVLDDGENCAILKEKGKPYELTLGITGDGNGVFALYSVKNKRLFRLFSREKGLAQTFYVEGDRLELNGNTLSHFSSVLDVRRHSVRESYLLEGAQARKTDVSFECARAQVCTELLPLALLQSLSLQDTDLAFCLSEELVENAQALSAFFGEIREVYPTLSKDVFEVRGSKNGLYKFEFEEGKISNVLEL